MAEWQWKRWDAVARLAAGKLTMGEAALELVIPTIGMRAGGPR